jgi:hypothetical protein
MGLSAVNNLVIDEVNYEIARRISYVASTGRYPTFPAAQVVGYGQDVLVIPDEVVQSLD